LTEVRTTPTSKKELIDTATRSWQAFITFTDNLAPGQWTGPTDPAGWSVKDHVAHVTAWDKAVIELLRHHTPEQRTLGVSDAAWTAGGFDPMNEEIRQQTLNHSPEAVRARRDDVWADLLDVLQGYSEKDLAGSASATGLTAKDISCLQLFDEYFAQHYDEHLRYIQVIVTGGES